MMMQSPVITHRRWHGTLVVRVTKATLKKTTSIPINSTIDHVHKNGQQAVHTLPNV